MKLKTTKRIFCLLSCLLVCALLSCTAFAGEAAWSLSYDEETLTYGEITFTLYEPYFPLRVVGDVVYCYNYVLNDYRSVDTNAEHDPTYADIFDVIYTTERGREALDRLMEGEADSYMLTSKYDASAPISRELVNYVFLAGTNGRETRTFDVEDLEDALYYTLLGVDEYGYYGCAYGAVYLVEGHLYYVHYMDLGNQCFDAYGNFSYRRGTVEAVRLTKDQRLSLKNTEGEMIYRPLEYVTMEHSGGIGIQGTVDSSSRSAFTTGMVVFGFLIPAPLLMVGLIFPRSAKRGYAKYWYVLAGIAALWMLLSVLLMVIVL